MRKKLLILSLLLTVAICIISVGCSKDTIITAVERPLVEIRTADDLKNVTDDYDYKLLNDIDLQSEDWTPVEDFSGTFDGNGHTISGLNIQGKGDTVGLFSTLRGTVKNLTLSNVTINCSGEGNTLGALCGLNKGTIDNVTVKGEVNAPYYYNVGGLAGKNSKNIANCKNYATVTGYQGVGGITGSFTGTKGIEFNGNANHGKINGVSAVGGNIGTLYTDKIKTDYTVNILNNVNCGEIVANNNYCGGIIGYAKGQVFRYEYGDFYFHNTFAMSGNSNSAKIKGFSFVGGLVGCGQNVKQISSSSNTAEIEGNNYVGGFAGYSSYTKFVSANNSDKITGNAYVGGIAGYGGYMDNCTNSGIIESKGVVTEDEQLISCVGGIAGYATGLTSCTNSADITVNTKGSYVGGIAGRLSGYSDSSIEYCVNDGNISGYKQVGGIVGGATITDDDYDAYTIEVNNNKNNGTVTGQSSYTGGIAGYFRGNYVKITPSYHYHKFKLTSNVNTAAINGEDYCGGIYGYGYYVSQISVCENNADVAGNNYVGGYVGYSSDTAIKLVSNTNTITGNAYVGGIAGLGGFIEDCTNSGIINSQGTLQEDSNIISCVGGIAGYSKGLNKCSNTSDIVVYTDGMYVGGITGYMYGAEGKDITYCVNSGRVYGYSRVGGIAGAVVILDKSYGDYTVYIDHNENSGNISAKNSQAAGITGYVCGYFRSGIGLEDYHDLAFSNNVNSGEIDSPNYVAGILAYGIYVNKSETLWNSNTNNGLVSGKNADELYAYIK